VEGSLLADQLFLALDFSELAITYHVTQGIGDAGLAVAFPHFLDQFSSEDLVADANSSADDFFDFLYLLGDCFGHGVAELLAFDGLESGEFEEIVGFVNLLSGDVLFEFHSGEGFAQSNDRFELAHSDGDGVFGLGQLSVLFGLLSVGDVDVLQFLAGDSSQTRVDSASISDVLFE